MKKLLKFVEALATIASIKDDQALATLGGERDDRPVLFLSGECDLDSLVQAATNTDHCGDSGGSTSRWSGFVLRNRKDKK